tara:strand:+ start:705 stop:923 length:219 start_codon:yes stop_codon:yes gene_type:complete
VRPADYIKKIKEAETAQEVLDLWLEASNKIDNDKDFLTIHRECSKDLLSALRTVPSGTPNVYPNANQQAKKW